MVTCVSVAAVGLGVGLGVGLNKSSSSSSSSSSSLSSLPGFGTTNVSSNASNMSKFLNNTGTGSRMMGACSDLSNVDSKEFETSVCYIINNYILFLRLVFRRFLKINAL